MLLKPDLTVYLELSLEDRVKRLGGRVGNPEEDRQITDLVTNHKLNELYNSYSGTAFVGSWLMLL